ncbi:MAG TPA: phosphatidylserine/phosphatidylglycerophosphate/cardiolipin synthase family protein [Methylomirabilota bacterium]|nr:phosphatidylserine/phosphatidylglycerophosphate/cardiolipin synthase family protein [Methylomirabilota bacterium]
MTQIKNRVPAVIVLAQFIVASFLVTAGLAATATEFSSSATIRDWTNSIPRAFLKDRHLRLYSGAESEQVLFEGEWEKVRVEAQEFSYNGATLKRDTSPPALPDLKSSWQEIAVIDVAQGNRLLRAFAPNIVPAERGHGIYVQHAMGDVVLFRDATGKLQLVPFDGKPADVTIDRRYSRHELASAAALFLEKELKASHPDKTAFVLLWQPGERLRITFLDLKERESLVLFPPAEDIPRGRPKLGGNLKTLASFAIVDNGWGFLKNPVSSATRTIHQGVQWTGTFFDPSLRDRASTIPPLTTNAPGMDLVAWEQWLDQRFTARERGSIRLLLNGEGFYPEFERRVAEATNKVDIHVCIFDRDDVAVRMADLFKARSTNIAVRVVFDRLNTRGAGGAPPATPMPDGFVPPSSITSYLRDGGEVRVRPLLNPGFSCDHSKVFIIDERYAYIGGMNFGREYRYEWHDLMAEVEGPVVASMQRQFNKKWAQAGVWGDCGLAAETMFRAKPHYESTNSADWIDLRRLYTKTFDRQIRRAELEAIDRARNHVFLENSYLYSNEMILALVRARLRGVDVRVIMPGENDFASGHSSNLVTSNFLRRHGVRVYFYPGMSHVKALLVDGWVCFGSANFDALSLRLNREGNLATSDAEFAARFRREVFETDFAKARELKEGIAVDWSDHLSDALLNPF